jgi:hypothetical protein
MLQSAVSFFKNNLNQVFRVSTPENDLQELVSYLNQSSCFSNLHSTGEQCGFESVISVNDCAQSAVEDWRTLSVCNIQSIANDILDCMRIVFVQYDKSHPRDCDNGQPMPAFPVFALASVCAVGLGCAGYMLYKKCKERQQLQRQDQYSAVNAAMHNDEDVRTENGFRRF